MRVRPNVRMLVSDRLTMFSEMVLGLDLLSVV